jgi:ADP-ribose pyrophosphatase
MVQTPRLEVRRDRVTAPGGVPIEYDWVQVPDQVRVAALVSGRILVVEQDHYLVGPMLQLPGGGVEPGEDARTCAQRELREETGYHGGRWHCSGHLFPVPGLSPMRVHLWRARDPRPGPQDLEPAEQDLRVHALTPAQAVAAIRSGRVRCAPSAVLILQVAEAAGVSPAGTRGRRAPAG